MEKYKKVLIVLGVIVLVVAVICFVRGCQKNKVHESFNSDFRSSSTELTSLDAARYLSAQYITENSVKGMEFDLTEPKIKGNWVMFSVMPLNVTTDTAKVYLSNKGGTWTVRGFGTVPPFEEKDYPF